MTRITFNADSLPELAEKIIAEYGHKQEPYKLSKLFLNELNDLTGQYDNIADCPEDEIEDLEDAYREGLADIGIYVNME